jgi:hypothetical protein
MMKKIPQLVALAIVVLIIGGIIYFGKNYTVSELLKNSRSSFLTPEETTLGDGNIKPLDQWMATTSPVTGITQRTYGKDLVLSGLESLSCLGTDSNGVVTAGSCVGGGGTFPFTVNAGYNSTTSVIGFFNGIFSNSSTTLNGAIRFPSLANGGLAVVNGLVYSGATTTYSGGLVYSNGNVTASCVAITGSADLCDGNDASGGAGTSAFEVATTSDIAVSQLSYIAKTGGRTTLASVATTSATCSGSVSCSQFTVIGSSPITLTGSNTGTFPFTATTNYNSTSTAIGFFAGLFSNSSTTINSNFFLPTLTAGALFTGTNGIVKTVATSTPTLTAPITYSGTLGSFLGGVSGAFDCTSASSGVKGCLTGTDWDTFNNKQGTITVSFPIQKTANALSWVGLATSSALTSGRVIYSTGVNTIADVATSSLAVGSSITSSGTLGSQIGGTASSLSLNMANPNTWTALQTFANSSTSLGSFNYASSTLYFGAGLANCSSENMLTWTNGRFGCESDTAGSGSSFPFSADSNYGQVVYSTSTPTLWFKSGLFASSTSHFVNASTTQITTNDIFFRNNSDADNRIIKVEDQTTTDQDGNDLYIIGSAGNGTGAIGSIYIQDSNSGSYLEVSDNNGIAINSAQDYIFFSSGTSNYNFSGPIYGADLNFSGISGSAKTFTFPNQSGTLCLTTTCSGTFPFDTTVGYNSTTSVIGFMNGLFSNSSTTINSNFFLPTLTAGALYTGSNGAVRTVATSSLAVGSSISSSGTLGKLLGGTDSTLSLNMANPNTWTALQTFNYSSTTYASFVTASTTNFTFGGVTGNKWTDFCTSITGSASLCDGDDAVGAGSSKWTDDGTFTYLTSTTDDLVVGASTIALAPFYWDVSATTSYIGNGGNGDSYTTYGKNGYQWTTGYDDTDATFAISSSTVLGTNNALTINKLGRLSFNYSSSTLYSSFNTASSTFANIGTLTLSTTTAGILKTSATGVVYSDTSATYGDVNVNSYIHSSTTIPKTYTANIFTALNTFTNASSTLFSSTYASSTNYLGGGLTTCTGNSFLQYTSSNFFSCAVASGGGSDPFTHPFAGSSATTSLMLFNGNASTSIQSVFGALYVGGTATSTILGDMATSTIIGKMAIGSSTMAMNNGFLSITAQENNPIQANIQNKSAGSSASSDWVATANNGSDSSHYINMGINGSGGGIAPFTTANHSYLYSIEDPLNIGALGASSYITFNTTGGTSPIERARITEKGYLGIGSSSPIANLTVIGGGATNPSFIVATTSNFNGNGTQAPIIFATATTTGDMDYSRVAIGTTTQWGNGGIRDQFLVSGRTYSTWRENKCDFMTGVSNALTGDTVNAATTLNAGVLCDIWTFDEDTDGGMEVSTRSYPPFVRVRGSTAGNLAAGEGAALTTRNIAVQPSVNPVLEAWVRTPSTVDTTTAMYMIGFIDTAFDGDYGSEPTNGVYFIASSTNATSNTWKAVVRSAGTSVVVNTGIATSSTAFAKLRVETTGTNATFLINGNVVARIVTTMPAVDMTPVLSSAIALTGGVATSIRNLDISLIRLWVDDPVGTIPLGNSTTEEIMSEDSPPTNDSQFLVNPITEKPLSTGGMTNLFVGLVISYIIYNEYKKRYA